MRPSPFYLVVGGVSVPFLRTVYRLHDEGAEQLPPSGGFVIAANHTSNFDPWPLAAPLFPRRHLRFMAKSELYWWPLGKLIDAVGGFPVKRGQRDLEAIETAIGLARDGNAVAMFPEGTRQKKGLRKKLQAKAHSGAARIALEAGVPLVPAAIAGTDRLARLARLRVRYGSPIALDDLEALELSAAAREATDRLMTEIARLREGL